MKYNYKHKIIENFGIGNRTTNNINYSANASFESNDRVNTSMMVESIKSVVNNAVNNIKQNNSAQAAALGSAVNTLSLIGVSAKNVIIRNIKQNAEANVDVKMDAAQSNISTIVNSMDTSIQTQITKESDISTTINQINKSNQDALQASIDAIPPIPNVPKLNAMDQVNKFFGMGNTTTNNIDVNYESNIKKMLDIDDSIKISDSSNTKNELVNIVVNTNYGTCEANAIAQNIVQLYNTSVEDNILIDDVSQSARANINLSCAFNQSNINNISNKIVSHISTTINNLYKSIKDKPDPKKYDFLHHLGAAISDKIIGASQVPSSNNSLTPTQSSTKLPNLSTKPPTNPATNPETNPETNPATNPATNSATNQATNPETNPLITNQSTTIYIIFSVVCFIIFFMIIIIIFMQRNK
jgi:hypothetical protein